MSELFDIVAGIAKGQARLIDERVNTCAFCRKRLDSAHGRDVDQVMLALGRLCEDCEEKQDEARGMES